jgi:cytoskeletal protein CcmA (bactofilin family)
MGLIRSKKSEGATDKGGQPPPGPSGPAGPADSLIGADMVLDGDCHTEGPLRVEGHVRGSVRGGRIVVLSAGRVDGDVTGLDGSDNKFLIEGEVGGGVRAGHVEVGPGGRIGAGIEATGAVVRGRVVGPVVARERLRIEGTAVVEGDVTAPRLAVEEGARVVGMIRAGKGRTSG